MGVVVGHWTHDREVIKHKVKPRRLTTLHHHPAMSALELLVVEVSKDIKFTLTDSGPPPNTENYTTLLIVHGHTYHAGMSSVLLDFSELKADLDLFKKLGPLAKASAVRVICVNRREYNGSTPHTPEELRVYKAGGDEERTMLLSEEGRNLALCMDAVIQKCAIPAAGHVALVGWSLGNTFTMAVMASIASLPYDSKYRLKESIKSFILWGTILIFSRFTLVFLIF